MFCYRNAELHDFLSNLFHQQQQASGAGPTAGPGDIPPSTAHHGKPNQGGANAGGGGKKGARRRKKRH